MRIAHLAALVLAGLAWAAAATAGPIDIGPPVGAKAPPLHAADMTGRAVDIRAISGRKGVVLLFFRSAKWCPYCQRQLLEFRDAQGPLEMRGYRLAAISYDSPAVLTAFADKNQVRYQLLSDSGSVTIDAFALRDSQYPPGSFAFGVPRPAIFVISRKGVIQAKLAEEGFKVRPSVQAVLAAVDNLNPQTVGAVR
jgi:peroxiredoxin